MFLKKLFRLVTFQGKELSNNLRHFRGGIDMMKTETWWEPIFSGNLSLGINKERLAELEEEAFIYFNDTEENETLEQ